MKIKIPKEKREKYKDLLAAEVTELERDNREFTWAEVKAMYEDGIEIENFPAVVEMTVARLDTSIPEGYPNREKEDGNAFNWEEYRDEFHHPVIYNNKAYISTNTFGADFDIEMLLLADAKNYITILSIGEYCNLKETWENN